MQGSQYKMKKKIAILFTLFASIVWVFSAVLPHHHHDDSICIETTHCNHDNEETHDHSDDHGHHEHEGHHDHEGQSALDHCVLDLEVILPHSDRHEIFEPSAIDKAYNGIEAICLRDNVVEPTVTKAAKRTVHQSINFKSYLGTTGHSHRGPPTV